MHLKLSQYLPFLCILCSTLYSYFVIRLSGTKDSFPTIFFIASLLILFFMEIYRCKFERINFLRILKLNIALYLGICIGFQLAGAPEKSIWMIDSYSMHLPGSVNIANVLHGSAHLRETSSIFDKIYFIHFWTGFWFWLIGVFPFVTILAMLPLKSLSAFCIYILGKKIFGEKEGFIAALIYVFMPTTLFYTITFYKEAMIHLSIASIYLSLFCIFINKEFKYFSLLIPAILVLSNERFYLFPIFLCTIILLTLSFKKISYKIKILICTMGSLATFIFFSRYQGQIPIMRILEALNVFRNGYNNYDDVKSIYNLQLPYPLAFLKLIFTPYFTFNKFSIFYDYSYLLIWGSPLNQIIVFLGVFELVNSIKKFWYFLFPLLVFLLIFSYISPYNGRLRDSFYPIIAVFSVKGFHSIIRLIQKIKTFTRYSPSAWVIIISLLFIARTSEAKVFWSAETSLFGAMTLTPPDTSYLNNSLYVIMNNGAQKSLFVAISKNQKWNSFLHLTKQETELPPKIAVLNGLVYFFYINYKTNHLHYISYNEKQLGNDIDTFISSEKPFEVTETNNQILISLTPKEKLPTLYTFDGKSIKSLEQVPLDPKYSIASICAQKAVSIFFQKPGDIRVWHIEKNDHHWSKMTPVKWLLSDHTPTIKCTNNETYAISLHQSKLSAYYFEPKIHKIENFEVKNSSPIDIITLAKISLSIIKSDDMTSYPRIIYNNKNAMALHMEGQVQSHPGILESLFNK